MARGRPVKSQIRQNIVEILNAIKEGYGYDIYKAYVDIFPKVTMRSIYYHLKKGVSIKELEVARVEKEKGNYSWGPEAEKIYYRLGPEAEPKNDKRVKKFFEKKK
jgi:DNA-binding transcriptional ArsR family regulator